MLSYIEYQLISLMLPIAIGLLSSIAVFIGGKMMKPKQLVRMVFPYVKKRTEVNQKEVLMFHYELSDLEVRILFSIVLLVVFSATFIFGSSFTQVSYKYNPFDSFDCFFTSNDSLVESSPDEALELEESVICFTVNFNIARSMGEAAGTLAFLWIFSSIMTWISVKIKKENEKIKKKKKKRQNNEREEKEKEKKGGEESSTKEEQREESQKENQERNRSRKKQEQEGDLAEESCQIIVEGNKGEEESQNREKKQDLEDESDDISLFWYISLIMIFYIFATVLSISLIIAGAFAFTRQFTDLLSSVEIMACGLILALQLIPLIVSDVIYIYTKDCKKGKSGYCERPGQLEEQQNETTFL